MRHPRSIRSVRPHAALALVGLVAMASLGVVGCSSGDGSDGGSGSGGSGGATTSTRRAATTTAAPTATTAGDATTTTTSDGGASGGPAPGTSGGPVRYRGTVEGKDATVTFTRSGDELVDLAVTKIAIECLPLSSSAGDPEITREVTVAIPSLAVVDGSVEGVARDQPYDPAVTGTFTDYGRFAATITFSGTKGGYACGGEYPFVASPT